MKRINTMMNVIALLCTVIVTPIVVGWIYGRNDINPDTPEGIEYYDGEE